MSTYVTDEECDRFCMLREDGLSITTIAQHFDRHPSTVDAHIQGHCSHIRNSRRDTDTTATDITDAIARLAAQRSAVPAKHTWENWEDRVCCIDTVVERFGSWESAIETAGLQPVADGAPVTIRKIAYHKPETTEPAYD